MLVIQRHWWSFKNDRQRYDTENIRNEHHNKVNIRVSKIKIARDCPY